MNQIDPKKEYSIRQIVLLGVMGKRHPTVLKKVLEDLLGDNLLEVTVSGPDDAKRYKVTGECLINYLKSV